MRYSCTMTIKIYHNPRCSKSRAALALLEDRGLKVEVVEYLKNPPSTQQIRRLLDKLDLDARSLVRKGESAFKESGLGLDSDEDALIALMAREPIVIERPIVETSDAARVGRPPERVLELID
jgi:arsenate reductase